jgi:hypothetical protein
MQFSGLICTALSRCDEVRIRPWSHRYGQLIRTKLFARQHLDVRACDDFGLWCGCRFIRQFQHASQKSGSMLQYQEVSSED